MQPVLNEEYRNEIAYAREELENAITNKSCAPIDMLRLAYASQFAIVKAHRDHDHDAHKLKTSDQPAGSSQPNTEIKPLLVDYNHDLHQAIDVCGNIKGEHPKITLPDLYQLAGVVAVKELGGPAIEFNPGRKDSSIPPDEGCVPYGRKGQSEKLREIFDPMGFDAKDIVALCGGLKLARANAGVEGSPKATNEPATNEPFKSVNSYFNELLNPNEIDKELVDDKEFHKYVKMYAQDSQDQKAFFEAYKESHKKLSEFKLHSWIEDHIPMASSPSELLNQNNLSNEIDKGLVDDKEFHKNVEMYAQDSQDQKAKLPEFKPQSWIEDHIPMASRAVGIAVAAAVAILSFFYVFKRRRASSKHSSQHPQ